MTSGVYEISSPSGGKYIGSAVRFEDRWRVHRSHLRRGNHPNPGLRRAAIKYGWERLKFKKIIVCRRCDVLLFEQIAITALGPKYNAAPVAGNMLGFKHSAETKAKIANLKRGRRETPEQRQRRSERMKGNTFNVGRSLSPETRARLSKALKKPHADGFYSLVTEGQKAEIVRSYLDGVGQVGLASKWKTSHKSIRRILISAGITISRSGHTIKRREPIQ